MPLRLGHSLALPQKTPKHFAFEGLGVAGRSLVLESLVASNPKTKLPKVAHRKTLKSPLYSNKLEHCTMPSGRSFQTSLKDPGQRPNTHQDPRLPVSFFTITYFPFILQWATYGLSECGRIHINNSTCEIHIKGQPWKN